MWIYYCLKMQLDLLPVSRPFSQTCPMWHISPIWDFPVWVLLLYHLGPFSVWALHFAVLSFSGHVHSHNFFLMPRKFLLIKWQNSFFLDPRFFFLPQDCFSIFFLVVRKMFLLQEKNLAARWKLLCNFIKKFFSWHQKLFLWFLWEYHCWHVPLGLVPFGTRYIRNLSRLESISFGSYLKPVSFQARAIWVQFHLGPDSFKVCPVWSLSHLGSVPCHIRKAFDSGPFPFRAAPCGTSPTPSDKPEATIRC